MSKAIAFTNSAAGGGGGVAAPSPTGGSSRPQLDRASLDLYEPVPKAWGADLGEQRGTIPFQFNPKEVTITKSARWGREPAKAAKSAGPVEFSGADPCKLSLEMFFDATGNHDGSVVSAVELLLRCCVPTEKARDTDKPSPVLVVFEWGKIRSFPAFVTQVSVKYTLFAADGTPIRASCSVSLEEMPSDPAKQNPTSGGVTVRRVRTVLEGDSLASLAYEEYGEPRLWRPLAVYNGIDDPMNLTLGQGLMIPPVDDLLPARG